MRNYVFCNENHRDTQCLKYDTVEKRKKKAQGLKLSLKCSRKNHQTKQCRINLKPCYYSKQKHDVLFCKTKEDRIQPLNTAFPSRLPTPDDKNQNFFSLCSSVKRDETFLEVKEVTVQNQYDPECGYKVVVLLDSGSQYTFIDVQLARSLRLKPLRLKTIWTASQLTIS